MKRRVAILEVVGVEVAGAVRGAPPKRVVYALSGSILFIADIAAVFVKYGKTIRTGIRDVAPSPEPINTPGVTRWLQDAHDEKDAMKP